VSEPNKKSFDRAGLEHPEAEEQNGSAASVPAVSDLPEQSVTPMAEDRGLFAWLYFHLTNLPSAVVVLSIIAGLSIIGTIVPQMKPAADYATQYGAGKARILIALGFHDIYHTVYFNVLLGWISVSAIVCSYLRFVRTWRLQFNPRVRIRARTIERLRHHRVVPATDAASEFSRIEGELKKRGFRTFALSHPDGALNLYASRGMRRMWALVVLHFALIMILIGALINLIFGQNGVIGIEDGQTVTLKVDAAEGKPALIQKLVGGLPPMEFTLHNEQFEITYDKLVKEIDWSKMGSNIPQAYKDFESFIVHQFTSNLTVERNGRKKSKVISVNYPLHLDKLVLYQSAFNRRIELVATIDGTEFRTEVSQGVPFEVTPDGLRAVPQGRPATTPFVFIIDDIKVGPWYQAGEYKGEIPPMAKLRVLDARSAETVQMSVITKDEPLSAPGFTLAIGDKIVSESIFQWKRDPGLPLVYLGFIFVVLGVLGTLYWRFQQAYVRVENGKLYIALRSTGIAEDAGKFLDGITAAG
jgi:cytochrome c biogenesis protein